MIPLCGLIVFFAAVGVSVTHFCERYCFDDTLSVAIGGFLELTKGVFTLDRIENGTVKFLLFAAFTSFGGVSVAFQSASLLRRSGLSPARYFLLRPLFAALAATLSYALSAAFGVI